MLSTEEAPKLLPPFWVFPSPSTGAFCPRVCAVLPPRHTTDGDLLAVAGGDVTDVRQLLEVLPGLVQKV